MGEYGNGSDLTGHAYQVAAEMHNGWRDWLGAPIVDAPASAGRETVDPGLDAPEVANGWYSGTTVADAGRLWDPFLEPESTELAVAATPTESAAAKRNGWGPEGDRAQAILALFSGLY